MAKSKCWEGLRRKPSAEYLPRVHKALGSTLASKTKQTHKKGVEMDHFTGPFCSSSFCSAQGSRSNYLTLQSLVSPSVKWDSSIADHLK
jgi:hypothetical protein